MSVDTYLYIDGKNQVWICTASCVCHHKKHCVACQKDRKIGKGKTLKDAIAIAEEYDGKNPLDVEYGVSFHLWCK